MKNKYKFLISVFLLAFLCLGSLPYAYSYNCAGSRGTEEILQIKIVNNHSLSKIFGSNWTDQLELLFGPGAHLKNAKKRTVVTNIDQNVILNFTQLPNLTNIEICNLTKNVWYWSLEGFDSDPDVENQNSQIMNNPENLTTWTNVYSTNMSDPSNVTMKYIWSWNWLAYAPVPPANYLNELVWETNYSIESSIVTHNVGIPYFVQIDNSTKVKFLDNCTEKFTYDSVYGALIDYTLRDKNGTVAYRYTVVLPPLIPGFELSIILGSLGFLVVVGVIYSIKKEKFS
ncbi:MAG: hypothetical protein EU551_04700 [Promethearchaeota archaeon]|nr:MAG: hypothetical protein EU551_04700 [Candidatus Lokiarchaeota archaeon]